MDSSSKDYINNYLTNNRPVLEDFRDKDLVRVSPTTILLDTIISYSIEIKTLFCSKCSINLTRNNYNKHIKDKHKQTYTRYKDLNILRELTLAINNLELLDLEGLKSLIRPNTYLFKELDIYTNALKCKECNFLNISRKEVRRHYNLEHGNNNKGTTKVDWILEGVPVQLLEGFKDNKKLYFIPKLPDLELRRTRDTRIPSNTEVSRSTSRSSHSSSSNSS